MDQGKLQQFDTPYNILFNPKNDYVKKLTATNNLYDYLKLLSVEDVMEMSSEVACECQIMKNTNLGDALTYMIKNGVQEIGISDGKVQLGTLAIQKIWDTVRPALQRE